MYVCICEGITESKIREAIHSGATSLESLKDELGLGKQCGTCVCAAEWVLEEVREELGDRRSRPSLTLIVSN